MMLQLLMPQDLDLIFTSSGILQLFVFFYSICSCEFFFILKMEPTTSSGEKTKEELRPNFMHLPG